MTDSSRMLGLRAGTGDARLFEQAAEQKDLTLSAWMREALREAALKQVYGTGDTFPASPGETALLRAVLVILQIVNRDIPEADQHRFAEKAASEIERIKAGE
ncbi:MAG: hypothetical protein GKS00_01890 [Alphaproteobacteria bacterium]|nr:hypothetical protein [Alphaproteobacteria bacterium]